MKLCNEIITVLNMGTDDDKGYDVYFATVISGVSWYCEIASAVDSSGLKAANKFTIRIPEDADFSGKTYVDPVQYTTDNHEREFTLRNGDIIVKGSYPGQIKPSQLQKIAGEIVTVLGVTDNRRAPNARHWKVVGA